MSELDQNGNFNDIVAELRSVAMIETGLLYSRRLMLNQASEEIERLRAQVTSANDNSARYCRELTELESRLAEARAEALEDAAKVADAVKAPKSIGRDHGRHHEAGAQSAARAIRALKG